MAAFESEKLAKLYPDHLRTVRERHDRALADCGYDAVVIAAGALRYAFLDDNAYGFRVNPHFKSWVPVIDNPNCFVVYKPGTKPSLVFFNPVDYWYKPAGTPKGFWVEQFDVHVIGDAAEAKQYFPRGRVAVVAEEEGAVEGADQNPEALLNQLHYERSWKTDYEIECLREANLRGARGHVAAARSFRDGESEYEMHMAYLRGSDATEEELPYGNIVAMNENASVLHYLGHERVRTENAKRYSFLIDAGAVINGYASDITRTYSRDEGDEFAQLIAAMDEMQQSLVRSVKPGVNYPDIHMAAHRGVAEILARFDLVRGLDVDGILEKRISSTFFPHGVGHYLGLQVHDVAGFAANGHGGTLAKPEGHPYLRLTRPIDARMVFTIEPGLYFIESLLADLKKSENAQYVNWPRVDAFRKFGGIRIEDDIVVTESGFENLTRDAFGRVGG
jgi:Xaa-Pro dipeptidase